jgi:hypothetical protein
VNENAAGGTGLASLDYGDANRRQRPLDILPYRATAEITRALRSRNYPETYSAKELEKAYRAAP